jgi:hypothetical protein
VSAPWVPGPVDRGTVERLIDAALEPIRAKLLSLLGDLGGYRIVCGTVNSDGSINTSGPNAGGWSSSRAGVGAYSLTFDPAFARVPGLLLTGWTASEIRHTAMTVSSATISCYDSAGGALDTAFDFVAIGR